MFSVAFGLIPLLAFINNIFEMLIDKHKVMHLTRRSVPSVAKGHGIFTYVFGTLSFLAIFTNIGIMAFTGQTFGDKQKYNAFLWFCIGCLAVKFLLSETIPDHTDSSYNVMQRHKVIVRKTLAKMFTDSASAFKVERISLEVLFTQKGENA